MQFSLCDSSFIKSCNASHCGSNENPKSYKPWAVWPAFHPLPKSPCLCPALAHYVPALLVRFNSLNVSSLFPPRTFHCQSLGLECSLPRFPQFITQPILTSNDTFCGELPLSQVELVWSYDLQHYALSMSREFISIHNYVFIYHCAVCCTKKTGFPCISNPDITVKPVLLWHLKHGTSTAAVCSLRGTPLKFILKGNISKYLSPFSCLCFPVGGLNWACMVNTALSGE